MRVAVAAALAMLAAVPLAPAIAQEITLSAEQSEYYFLVNDPVRLQVMVNNTHAVNVQGTIVSVLERNSGGVQLSSSNSNNVSIAPGESSIDIDLGAHAAPATMSVDLLLSYIEDGAKIVDLDPLTVHVVAENAEEQNVPNPTSATSQEAQDAQPQQQQSSQSQNAQQRLQNSQLAQDSSALREEIREQIRQDAAEQEGLLRDALESEEFAELHEELASQGYSMSSQSASASGESSGSFEFMYENAEGEWASIDGELEDGEVTQIEARTQAELDEALEALRADAGFQELAAQLEGEGYEEYAADVTRTEEGAMEASVTFAPPSNSTAPEARITALVTNSTVSDVRLERESASEETPWALLAAVSAAAAVVAYAAYRLLRRRAIVPEPPEQSPPARRDYALEAERLLEEAVRAHADGRRKLAYGMVGQALRLSLAHTTGLDREASNTEILRHLRERGDEVPGIAECLGLTGLVSFARHSPGEDDFEGVMAVARRTVGGHRPG